MLFRFLLQCYLADRKIILLQKLIFAGTNFFHSGNRVVNIPMRKIMLEEKYLKSMIYQILTFFKKITYFITR